MGWAGEGGLVAWGGVWVVKGWDWGGWDGGEEGNEGGGGVGRLRGFECIGLCVGKSLWRYLNLNGGKLIMQRKMTDWIGNYEL